MGPRLAGFLAAPLLSLLAWVLAWVLGLVDLPPSCPADLVDLLQVDLQVDLAGPQVQDLEAYIRID